MNFIKYYQQNKTYQNEINDRFKKIINIIKENNQSKILDVGCGDGFLLKNLRAVTTAKLYGVDVHSGKDLITKKISYKKGDITKKIPFDSNMFDCLILGEVIEHVPNPDLLLSESGRVLKKDGVLIISTPNIVSWANRMLVPLGVQPLFTETSSEENLGRYFKALGQGGKVQGHLKIFTHRSLKEILEKENFQITKKIGVQFFFPFPLSLIDKFFAKFISMSSDLLYVAINKK